MVGTIPILAKLRTAFAAGGVLDLFPGGATAGERFDRPAAWPFLAIAPQGETKKGRTNKTTYSEMLFDIGIAERSLEQCGDEALTSALISKMNAITAGGPVSLGSIRLIALKVDPESVRFVQDDGFWVCWMTWIAQFSR